MRMAGIVTGARAELLRLGNRGAMGYLYGMRSRISPFERVLKNMKALLVPIACLLLAGCSHAEAPATDTASVPAVSSSTVQKALADTGIEITGKLDAPEGYEGFVGVYQGRSLPVYVLPDGKHLVIGSIYDMSGHDLTSPAMRRIADSGFGAAQWSMLEKATWVVEGNPHAKRVVYVFADTRCPYCHHLWQASQQWLERGNVQVRTIPVAVISPDSLPEAAVILDADDPAKAWRENERHFGSNPKPDPGAGSKLSRQKIRANSMLMNVLGFHGTPAMIYKNADGKVRILRGLPRDPDTLREVFGG